MNTSESGKGDPPAPDDGRGSSVHVSLAPDCGVGIAEWVSPFCTRGVVITEVTPRHAFASDLALARVNAYNNVKYKYCELQMVLSCEGMNVHAFLTLADAEELRRELDDAILAYKLSNNIMD